MDIRIAGSPLDRLDFPISACWSAPGKGRYYAGVRNLKEALETCCASCLGAGVCHDDQHDILLSYTTSKGRLWGIDWLPVVQLSGCNLALSDLAMPV